MTNNINTIKKRLNKLEKEVGMLAKKMADRIDKSNQLLREDLNRFAGWNGRKSGIIRQLEDIKEAFRKFKQVKDIEGLELICIVKFIIPNLHLFDRFCLEKFILFRLEPERLKLSFRQLHYYSHPKLTRITRKFF